jgi:tripartite ATP-independent transporter DctM subunit
MEARILGTEMIKRGYPKGYTASITALSALITATIPPGIGLILYGFIGEVSIGRLFIAGIIPGILMCLIMMSFASGIAIKRKYEPAREKRATFKEFINSFFENIWALIFPLILIIGIRFGIFTPSEAGAFAVVYALIIGTFVYKELDRKKLIEALRQTAEDNGVIMLIIICSSIFGYVIIYNQAPQSIAQFLAHITTNPTLLVFIILSFLVVAGMFMEPTVNTLLLTPIFLPIVRAAGVDPVHFGILMMTIITMGSMTPPVGVVIYTVCSILDCPIQDYIKESVPFVLSVVILIFILTLFPQIVLFLPKLVYGS